MSVTEQPPAGKRGMISVHQFSYCTGGYCRGLGRYCWKVVLRSAHGAFCFERQGRSGRWSSVDSVRCGAPLTWGPVLHRPQGVHQLLALLLDTGSRVDRLSVQE